MILQLKCISFIYFRENVRICAKLDNELIDVCYFKKTRPRNRKEQDNINYRELTNVLKLVLKVVAIKNFFSIYDKHIILMKYYLPLNLDSKSTVQRNPVNVLP